jgi:ABC-type transporter Mla subunit MlaD
MDPLAIALLTLAALLTGALLPLIFQARATLRSAQRVLDTSGPRLERTLTDMAATTQEVMAIAQDVTKTLDQVRGTVRTVVNIGGVVGPAVMAAVQAFQATRALHAREARTPEQSPEQEHGASRAA